MFMVEFIYVLPLDQFAETASDIIFVTAVIPNISFTGCYPAMSHSSFCQEIPPVAGMQPMQMKGVNQH